MSLEQTKDGPQDQDGAPKTPRKSKVKTKGLMIFMLSLVLVFGLLIFGAVSALSFQATNHLYLSAAQTSLTAMKENEQLFDIVKRTDPRSTKKPRTISLPNTAGWTGFSFGTSKLTFHDNKTTSLHNLSQWNATLTIHTYQDIPFNPNGLRKAVCDNQKTFCLYAPISGKQFVKKERGQTLSIEHNIRETACSKWRALCDNNSAYMQTIDIALSLNPETEEIVVGPVTSWDGPLPWLSSFYGPEQRLHDSLKELGVITKGYGWP